jgi:hypothetical protein
MKRTVFPIVLILLGSQLLMKGARAQSWMAYNQGGKQATNGASSERPIARNVKDPFKDVVLLKDKVRIDDLPEYPGRTKFLGGRALPNQIGGQSYDMDISVTETPEQVMGWYKQALANYQWKTTSEGDRFVTAVSRRGDRCSISAGPDSRLNGGRAKIHFMYQRTKITL